MAKREALAPKKASAYTAPGLLKRLAPFRMLCTKHALSAQYKTLELTPAVVRGLSSYAQLEVDVVLDVPQSVFVDADTFLTILASLPAEEIKLTVSDGVVNWKCGSAKGKLATVVMPVSEMPVMKKYKMDNAWVVPSNFGMILDLGSASCDNNTLKSIGMYGIVIDNREDCVVYSCDNVTASSCQVSDHVSEMPDIVTLPPDGAKLLSILCKTGALAKILFMENALYYRSEGVRLMLRQIPALEKDIAVILEQFSAEDMKAEIPPDRVSAFIRRVGAIAETKGSAHVELKVNDGQIALSFSDGLASSDEYYLIDGLEDGGAMAVSLNAEKLARAMAHVDSMVLDHMGRMVVVLSGKKMGFKYLISGKAGAQA